MTVRELRPGGTRASILEAARDLFGGEGFDSTTVKQIAARVGLTDAALYHHFKNKREILDAIWELPVGGGPSRDSPVGALTAARLWEIVESALEFTIQNSDYTRLVLQGILRGDETARAMRQQNRSIMHRTLYEHFLKAFSPDVAELRAEAVLMLFVGSTLKLLMESGAEFGAAASREQFRETLRMNVEQLAGLEDAVAV